MLQTVIDRDPADFMALAMMSYCRLTEVVCGYREIRDTDGAAALDFARRAVRLNEKSDFAHSSLCHALLYCDRDFDTAEREASRSLELNPSFALSMYQLGEVRIFHDRVENGIDLCLKAVDANKRGLANHWIMRVIAIGQFVLGQYEAATDWAKRSDQQMPDVVPTLLILTTSAAHAGQAAEARRAAERLLALHPDITIDSLRRWPFSNSDHWDHFIDGLRKAGLGRSDGPDSGD